jgi:hypothetical protein
MRSLLAQLGGDIRIIGTKPNGIMMVRRSRISPDDAQASKPKINNPAHAARLTRQAIKALLKGKHAHLGGKSVPTRAKNLLRIAAAYTYEELFEEPGIGNVTAAEIRLWIEERGVSLRASE